MRRTTYASTLLLLALVLACGVPRVTIKQTFDRRETIDAGGSRVEVYETRAFRDLDSAHRLLRVEYLPVRVYAVVDARDSIELLVVAAWQEVLWRFSERLSPTDKQYYAPIPLNIARTNDSATVTWGYPSLDTRDDDLKYVTPYRNAYWSVDSYKGRAREEVFAGVIRSHPQYDAYDPLKRFVRGGTYDRAASDTLAVLAALRTYLRSRPASDARDTTKSSRTVDDVKR